MTTSDHTVLDSSFIIKLILKEDDSEKVLSFMDRLTSSSTTLVSPRYMLAEVFSTLCKKYKFGYIKKDELMSGLKILKGLEIKTIQERNSDFIEALNMAIKTEEPTIYDSLFLCLAIKLNAEFITADAKYYKKAVKYYAKCTLV